MDILIQPVEAFKKQKHNKSYLLNRKKMRTHLSLLLVNSFFGEAKTEFMFRTNLHFNNDTVIHSPSRNIPCCAFEKALHLKQDLRTREPMNEVTSKYCQQLMFSDSVQVVRLLGQNECTVCV